MVGQGLFSAAVVFWCQASRDIGRVRRRSSIPKVKAEAEREGREVLIIWHTGDTTHVSRLHCCSVLSVHTSASHLSSGLSHSCLLHMTSTKRVAQRSRLNSHQKHTRRHECFFTFRNLFNLLSFFRVVLFFWRAFGELFELAKLFELDELSELLLQVFKDCEAFTALKKLLEFFTAFASE